MGGYIRFFIGNIIYHIVLSVVFCSHVNVDIFSGMIWSFGVWHNLAQRRSFHFSTYLFSMMKMMTIYWIITFSHFNFVHLHSTPLFIFCYNFSLSFFLSELLVSYEELVNSITWILNY